MTPPVRSGPPPDAAGVGYRRRSSAPAWTEEKRRKTVGARSPPGLGSSSSSDDATEAMLLYGNRSQIQEEEARVDLFFSAEEDLDAEEVSHCRQLLKSREPSVPFSTMPPGECRRRLYQRFTNFRLRDFKLMEDSLKSNGTANTVVVSDEFWSFESPHLPGRGSMLGWTVDHKFFYLDDLDDYQRIVLTRADVYEYPNWEKYQLMFSKLETDEEYVRYWDQLFERIKWIGDYLDLGFQDFDTYRIRGLRQAMKIAASSFYHLPSSLAILGYNEYVSALKHDNAYGKGYVRAHLELWKRVTKHNMSFKDALMHILTLDCNLPSGFLDTIDDCEYHFRICMNHIKEHIVDGDDDTVLKRINDVLYPEIGRPQMYVDYAKKKLLVARRIGIGKEPQGTWYVEVLKTI